MCYVREEDRVRLGAVSRSLLWWLCFNVDGRKNFPLTGQVMTKELEVRCKDEVGKEYLEIIPSSLLHNDTPGCLTSFPVGKYLDFLSGLNRKWLMPSAPRIAVCGIKARLSADQPPSTCSMLDI